MQKIGVAVVVVLLLIGGAWFLFSTSSPFVSGVGTFSDGYKSGYVYKLSYKGKAYKAWEGSMLLGPSPHGFMPTVSKDGVTVSNTFDFSIEGDQDDPLAKRIIAQQVAGTYCTLHYDQKRFKGTGTDTSYIIIDMLLPPSR